jgi:hypothetical protein
MKTKAGLFAAAALLLAVAATAGPVRTERAACDLVKARVAARGNLPVRRIAFCDIIPPESGPTGFYVLALHSDRACDGICSTNMGWFAVQRATGRLFEWDVAEQRLGPSIGAGR